MQLHIKNTSYLNFKNILYTHVIQGGLYKIDKNTKNST